MAPGIDSQQVGLFRAAIARRFGLNFDLSKDAFLGEVLRRRSEHCSLSPTEYLQQLTAEATPKDLRSLCEELTVSETYFFRNADQLRAFSELVVPERMRSRVNGVPLRVLSAGCASGEEPYSLAILLREGGYCALESSDTQVLGVDINPQMIRKARVGRYTPWALRETSDQLKAKWFVADGRDLLVHVAIRASVTFEECNLSDETASIWKQNAYDIIFCRNVIMYFTLESACSVVERLTRSLAPGGFLFLGHAETLRGLSQDYHLRHTHGTFYYQRKDSIQGTRRDIPAASSTAPTQPLDSTVLELLTSGETWMDTIRKAADRIQALTTPSQASPEDKGKHPAASWDLALPFELLRKERYLEAIEVIRSLPPESRRNADVLLLTATLLTHGGRLDTARDVCNQLLELDSLNAGAHYLLALCAESEGSRQIATNHDQAAIYLDASFAMPRLHLGLMARRAKDYVTARRELTISLNLLQSEDSMRLLLFAGGFSRETLVALCRTELSACGAARV